MESMNKEICDYYTPIDKKQGKLCKYFIGNKNKQCDIDRCRQHCSILESRECMQERSYKRGKGALRQK